MTLKAGSVRRDSRGMGVALLAASFFLSGHGALAALGPLALPATDVRAGLAHVDIQSQFPWIVLIGGGICCLAFMVVAWLQTRGRTSAERVMKELQKSDQALRESEARYRRLAENARDVIYRFRLGPNRGFEYVSQAISPILGFTPEQVYSDVDLIWKQLHPEDQELVHSGDFLQNSFSRAVAIRWLRKCGKVVWLELRNVPVKDSGGKVVAVEGIARDITEDKLADEKLLNALEYTHNLFESSLDMIVSVDAERRVIEFNRSAQETFGWSKAEVLGQCVDVLYADPEDGRTIYKTTLSSGEFRGEVRNRRKNGELFYSYLSSSVLKDKHGRVIGLMGVSRDITGRKAAEDALRKAEAFHRTLVESLPQSIFRKDVDGRFTFANGHFASSIGKEVDDIRGRTDLDFYPESLAEQYRAADQRVMSTRRPLDEIEENHPPGKEKSFVHIIKTPIIDANDQVIGIQGIFWDVTEKRRAENALAAETERLAVTLRSIGDGVITTDTAGRVVLINRVAEKLTGWQSDEAVGKPLGQVFHIINDQTGETCQNPVEKVLGTGEIVGLANHTVLVARDGTRRVIADSGAPIRDSKSRVIGVVLVFRDVTEAERLEKELLRASKLESIGLLAGGIAHDFNNILTGILGNVSLAKMFGPQEGDMPERLAQAERACLRARDLVQQLLTFAHGGEPVKRVASLIDVVRESTDFALRGSNVRSNVVHPPDIWPVEVDESQIIQVVNNLIINASEAMPEGGVINVSLENVLVEVRSNLPVDPGKHVKISIQDHGVGIRPEHLPKIFDPYFSTKQRGSGLGLATAYSIVRRHGGMMLVDSKIGIGTIFHVYLPASDRKVAKTAPENPKADAGCGRILVMDDEPFILNLAEAALTRLGYEVECVTNGADAIRRYEEARNEGRPFAAVIMDLTIPGGMGGKEAIRRLQAIDPRVRALVSSGYSNDPVMANFRDYGFSGVVTKPYQVEQLARALHRIIFGDREAGAAGFLF